MTFFFAIFAIRFTTTQNESKENPFYYGGNDPICTRELQVD